MSARIVEKWRRFIHIIDSESVRLYVGPFYMALLAFGLYAEFAMTSDNLLSEAMGPVHYGFWVWTQIVAAIAVLAGLCIRGGGKPISQMSTTLLWVDWMGLFLQLGGHLCMFWVLVDFEIFAAAAAHWGTDLIRVFAVFSVAPSALGCLMLAFQIGRKIRHGEKLNKRIEKAAGG